MLILSDCPGQGLAVDQPWLEVSLRSLPPSDQQLCTALGAGERLWQGTLADTEGGGFWSRSLIVAEAPASQFDTLRELLGKGLELPGPVACLALSGRRFHGQHGRPWLAAPGNLHLCVALPSPGLAARHAGSLAMLPAVALVEAIEAMTGGSLRAGIKWVNDILIEGRKVGGVLTATQSQGNRLSAVLLGIGLNLAAAPAVAPTPFVPAVGSLAAAGANIALGDAIESVLAALSRRASELVTRGPETLLAAYRAASLVIGREVCVFEEATLDAAAARGTAQPFAEGTVRGIADDLSLLLDGAAAPVARGRLAFAESCRRFRR